MTGYFACLESYIFRGGTRFVSFYSKMFQVSLNTYSESSRNQDKVINSVSTKNNILQDSFDTGVG